MKQTIGLIGLGAIGAPIAHRLHAWDAARFALVADPRRRGALKAGPITINGTPFSPQVVSTREELAAPLDVLIVCVKNFQLEAAIADIRNVVSPQTVILPLENGVVAYYTLRRLFPSNVVLEGYAQGPNTTRTGYDFVYANAGRIHMGSSKTELCETAIEVYLLLKQAGIDVLYEAEIRKMVWTKWMLNTAGNYVTALLDANYADFRKSPELQDVCRVIKREFLQVARAKNIQLGEDDIESVIQYYVEYSGGKRTSMLEDVCSRRQTENEYIAGEVLRLARQFNIAVPAIETVYLLIKAKESLYL